jgi:hypothetical protein
LTDEQVKANQRLRGRFSEVVEWMVVEEAERHYLYHLMDSSGRLLYIGISNNPYNRMNSHLKGRPGLAKMIVVESYATRQECREAEKQAIAKFCPPLNVKFGIVTAR